MITKTDLLQLRGHPAMQGYLKNVTRSSEMDRELYVVSIIGEDFRFILIEIPSGYPYETGAEVTKGVVDKKELEAIVEEMEEKSYREDVAQYDGY